MATGIEIDDGKVHVPGVERLNVVGGSLIPLEVGAAQLTLPVLSGTAAPNTGQGVVHAQPCLYIRLNGSATELWVATGAGNTAWTQVTVP